MWYYIKQYIFTYNRYLDLQISQWNTDTYTLEFGPRLTLSYSGESPFVEAYVEPSDHRGCNDYLNVIMFREDTGTQDSSTRQTQYTMIVFTFGWPKHH